MMLPHDLSSGRRQRGGFLLIELSAAIVVLVAALIVLMKLLTWTAIERRSAERRGWAIQEAANLMERLTALPRIPLDPASARAYGSLSPATRSALPEGRIAVDLHDEATMTRITITVRWLGVAGREEAPVRLTSWVARRGELP